MATQRSGARLAGRLALAPATAALAAISAAIEGMDYTSALSLGHALGRIWFHALPIRRRIVSLALARTFPNWDGRRVTTTTRRVLERCAANVTTLIWATARHTSAREILEVVRFEGLDHYDNAARTGAVLAASHTGNWDLAALAAAARGVPLTVVSRNLSYGPLDRMWNGRRARSGVKLLDESAGLGPITQAAGPGRFAALLVDQRTGPRMGGIRLPFLGREAWTSTLPAAVALRRGLPMLPITSRVATGGTLVVKVGPRVGPADGSSALESIRAMTLTLSRRLEDWIWSHPDSWLWLHRRWAGEEAHQR